RGRGEAGASAVITGRPSGGSPGPPAGRKRFGHKALMMVNLIRKRSTRGPPRSTEVHPDRQLNPTLATGTLPHLRCPAASGPALRGRLRRLPPSPLGGRTTEAAGWWTLGDPGWTRARHRSTNVSSILRAG